ncbi:MAG: SpoIIE family protein phosphatase [Acidimicrobiales bacterium]
MNEGERTTHRDGGSTPEPRWATDLALVDSLNDAVIVADDTGRILYANRAAGRLLGWDPAELSGSSLLTLIPERLRHLHEAAFAEFVSSGVLKRGGQPIRVPALRADGTETPIELLTSTLEGSGGARMVVGTLRDARSRIDIERHRQVADQLLDVLGREVVMSRAAPRVLEAIGTALDWDIATFWIAEPDMTLRCRHFWHSAGGEFERFTIASLGTTLGPEEGLPGLVLRSAAPIWVVDLSAGPNFPRRRDALDDGLRTAVAVPVFADGETVGVVELLSREIRQEEVALLDAMATIGDRLGPFFVRIRSEEERERMLVELGAAKRAQEFVLEISKAVAEAKDYRQTIERLAKLALPTLGDICLIDVVDANGNLRRMAAHHRDPARQAMVDLLERHYSPETGGAHPVNEVITSGQSRWATEMPDDFLRDTTRDEHHLSLVSTLGFSSYMSVPLIAGTTVLGAVTLVSAGSGRRFSESDLALAENLASQVAAVVGNARAYDVEHRIAHTLQRSLLPDRLVVPERFEVAARYLPATEGAEVGGDWYDLFPLPDGRVVAVVGDVEGHDMFAASIMGQLRSALRICELDLSPGEALGRLSRFSLASNLPRMATALVMVVDLETGKYTMASAGHHPPMLVAPPAEPRLLSVRPGPPIGAWPGDYEERTGQLAVGDTLILYTDGLIDGRATTIEGGIDRIARAASEHTGNPEELCTALERSVVRNGEHEDDVAYLVMRRTALPSE